MKIAIVVYPGSNCDRDVFRILNNVLNVEAKLIWHTDKNIDEFDGIILPGGFSYGDYLRAGVIAAYSPIMEEIKNMAREGKPVLGICNGFQILVEAGLLPGALLRNIGLKFICKWVGLKVENSDTIFTRHMKKDDVQYMPIAHNEGRYFIDEDDLKELKRHNQIVFRYTSPNKGELEDYNPNGSVEGIAGVCNDKGNVMGLMPHPERASEKLLSPYGDNSGINIFSSIISSIGE